MAGLISLVLIAVLFALVQFWILRREIERDARLVLLKLKVITPKIIAYARRGDMEKFAKPEHHLRLAELRESEHACDSHWSLVNLRELAEPEVDALLNEDRGLRLRRADLCHQYFGTTARMIALMIASWLLITLQSCIS